MACNVLKGLCATAFVSIASVVLAVGRGDPLSTPGNPAAASVEVSQALVGNRITIHGKFSLRGKFGPYIMLDNQQVVYLVSKGSFTWGKPFSEMEGKLVAATGILRFYHAPSAKPSDQAVARAPDHFYFEAETAQLRLISN